MNKFVNLRIVNNISAFELLLLKNDPDHECIEYNENGSNGYNTITKWAQIGNLRNVSTGIKTTHNGILYSEECDSFVEFNHKNIVFDFRRIKCFGTVLGNYLNEQLDQIETFIIDEDDYSSIIYDAEQIGCIGEQIRIKRKLIALH
ncbi:Hypothetical protein PACV_103 [Pacmanvirus A23]|uniref:Hypothetical protein n=1 Tax=Pacmanvirus A23 TaxID=1932881 RepID=UPI000A0923E6|nr:Hypothetical protein B9W72_gp102 [Pacmanvirus A23]SIP85819.1 Hypothetical protein PACV_103 [Pacmanvirus A23]